MIQKMQTVEKALERWQKRTGRLPEAGRESEVLQSKLSVLAGNNAYADFEERLAMSVQNKRQSGSPAAQEAEAAPEQNQADEMTQKKIADDEQWQYIKMAPPVTPVLSAPTAVKIKVDLALSQLQLQNYVHEAPAAWHEPAGTISIVHNTERFFLVWGAGVDGKPLKAPGQSRPFLLTPGSQ
jgi:hypothetical protein